MTVNTEATPQAREIAGNVTRKQQRAAANNWRVMDAVKEWFATRDPHDHPSQRDLAAIAGVSVATVNAALRSLHRAGLVKHTGTTRGIWLPEHE